MKVHLVDGTYELFRQFYAPRPGHQDDEGVEIGAVRSVVQDMLAMLEGGATHLGVATDQVIESFRNDLWDGYKDGSQIDPDLFGQFPLLEDACRALGIVVWPMIELECDDALATAAARFAAQPEVDQVVICSPDKDLAQCVRGARVVCLDRLRGKTLDEDGVHAKFGVGPASIPDWLALVGDAADGYPGIPRWGAKSASAVLAAYGRLDRIPDDAAAWTVKVRGAAALAQSLAERRAEALLYRTLATLREDAPLAETLADLDWRGPAPAADPAAVLRLELDGVLERAADVAARKANGVPKR